MQTGTGLTNGTNTPHETMDPLSNQLAGMSKQQLYDLLSQMKVLIQTNHAQARAILVANPQLAKALFQAQVMLGMVKPSPLPPVQQPHAGPAQPTTQTSVSLHPSPPVALTPSQSQPGPIQVPPLPPQPRPTATRPSSIPALRLSAPQQHPHIQAQSLPAQAPSLAPPVSHQPPFSQQQHTLGRPRPQQQGPGGMGFAHSQHGPSRYQSSSLPRHFGSGPQQGPQFGHGIRPGGARMSSGGGPGPGPMGVGMPGPGMKGPGQFGAPHQQFPPQQQQQQQPLAPQQIHPKLQPPPQLPLPQQQQQQPPLQQPPQQQQQVCCLQICHTPKGLLSKVVKHLIVSIVHVLNEIRGQLLHSHCTLHFTFS
eukprot:TRINITY_DN852_c0_g1_i4.p1 TRINITY_DN852_c0_g1~~TRINITY_DN852_c0_g1_i4.p1  ORF type:complete len:365 (+),score=21.63 TRINITY_DN852_c0_g1_i4:445-1539(+)